MYCSKKYITTSLLAISLAAPVAADVAPKDVWDVFEAYMTANGYTVASQQAEADGVLTVSDIEMRMTFAELGGESRVNLSQLKLKDQGDGSVAMLCDTPIRAEVMTQLPDEAPTSVVFDLDCTQLDMLITGTPEAFTATQAGPELRLNMVSSVLPDSEAGLANISLLVTDIDGKIDYVSTDGLFARQSLTAGSVEYVIGMNEPGGDSLIDMKMNASGFSFDGEMTLSKADTPPTPQQVLGNMVLDGTYSAESSTSSFTYNTRNSESTVAPGEVVPVMGGKLNSGPVTARVALNAGEMILESKGQDIEFDMTDGVPLPISLQMAVSAMSMKMPLTSSDEARDFSLSYAVRDFEMAEGIWGLFDPAAALPRDPMTVELDLDGKMRLLVDLMDPAALVDAQLGDTEPVLVDDVNLKALRINMVGAELTGSGALSMDYESGGAPEGQPAVDGNVSLELSGGNGLLDNLVASGLIPEDQAMGARMMVGMFARPGDGEDELVSEIEFRPDGQIIANGQRVK